MSIHHEAPRELIERAKQSEDAFIELYNQYVARVLRFLLVKTGQREVAEDIAQETFLTVLQKLNTYTVRGAPFSVWLFQIALNHLRMYYRKNHRTESLRDDDGEVIFDIAGEDSEYKYVWMDFFLALRRLTDEDQNLLLMKYIDDKSNGDIAKTLAISSLTCGVKIHRALKRLQRHL